MGSSWCVLVVVLCALAWAAVAQDAPAPEAAGPANLTEILEKGGQYTILIRLLEVTSVGKQITSQLNTSTEGLTVLAPTDNAFNNLKAGTLNDLSTQDQVNLILFHVLPKYYSLEDLLTVSNPVRTQYSVDGLNFTGQSRDLNVSSGLVETRLNNALRQQFPLAVYQLDQVLLPLSFYSPRPAPPPAATTPATKTKTNSSSSADSPSNDQESNHSPAGPTVPLGFLFALIASYFF